jgi:hypothetical protein
VPDVDLLQGVNPALGLSKSSREVLAEVGDGGRAVTNAPVGSGAAAPFVPAASVTAALHMRLGPSVTHGSALTNSIHPSEFTGFPNRPGATRSQAKPGDLRVPHAVLAEEVLMYHRAASRLAEMCRVV